MLAFRTSTTAAAAATAPMMMVARALSSTAKTTAHREPVQLTVSDKGVATLTLNAPATMNAMTVEMGRSFHAKIDELRSMRAEDVRAIVVTGSGRAFSAGGDLDFLVSRTKLSAHQNSQDMKRFYDRFLSIRDIPVPTIAAINGAAVGAGACLAIACDIRVAAPTALIGFTFANLGLHPGMGATHFLPQIVGHEQATRMLLTGETMTADAAAELGLISKLSDDPYAASMRLAERIAKQSTVASREITHTLRINQQTGMTRALWREAHSQALCYSTDEYKKRVAAVQAKVQGGKSGK